MISRRQFLRYSVAGTGAACLWGEGLFCRRQENGLFRGPLAWAESGDSEEKFLREAQYFKQLPGQRVECQLCPRKCQVADKERGYCGVRENRKGKYYTLVYGRPCTYHVDPVEKKPLFHYLPGSQAFSLATAGCNIECKFCQNWEISQFRPEQVRSLDLPPEKTADLARQLKSRTIAYTYSEPVIFYEYMLATARAARKQRIGSVMISNGYILEEPLRELCQSLTAVKIDLKAFTEKFYKDLCSGELRPVLSTIELLKKIDIWFELVVLLIPTLNDGEDEIKQMSRWIKSTLGPGVPVHFSRFHPTYKITNIPRTPVRTLERAREIARAEGLNFAYVGNVPGHEGENTYCPNCGKTLIRRVGYRILKNEITAGACPGCHTKIPGIWNEEQIVW